MADPFSQFISPQKLVASPYLDIRTACFDDQVRCKTHDFSVDADEIAARSKKKFPGLWLFGDFEDQPNQKSEPSEDIIPQDQPSVSAGKCLAYFVVVHNLPAQFLKGRKKGEAMKTLIEIFKNFGQILSVNFEVSGKSGENIALVEFGNREQAENAVSKISIMIDVQGAELVCELTEKYKSQEGNLSYEDLSDYKKALFLNSHPDYPVTVFQISGWPSHITKTEILQICQRFATIIESAVFFGDPESGKSVAILVSTERAGVEECVKNLNGAVLEDSFKLSACVLEEADVKLTDAERRLRVTRVQDVFTGICKETVGNSWKSKGILVKNLTENVTEKRLHDFFGYRGKILSIFIKKEPFLRGQNKRSLGFVYFEASECAYQVAKECHRWILDGQRVEVYPLNENFRRRKIPDDRLTYDWYFGEESSGRNNGGKQSDYQLFIGNLPINVKQDQVKNMCRPYGILRDVYIERGQMVQARGYNIGYVKYRELASVFKAASALNGQVFGGFTLTAEPSKLCRLSLKKQGKDQQTLIDELDQEREEREYEDKRMTSEEKGLIWQLLMQWETFASYSGCGWSFRDLNEELRQHESKGFDIGKPVLPQKLPITEDVVLYLKELEKDSDSNDRK